MQDAPGSHPVTSPITLPVVDSPSDADLVAAVRSGDDFAFSRLWHRHESAATTAASATPGHAGVEQVVAAAAALVEQTIREGGGPAGAARPYVLAAVREAAAAADGRAAGLVARDPSLLAPAEWYAETLPDGLRDGVAVVEAYATLPVVAQEALWLAEIDGHSTADIAAELGLTLPRTDGLLLEASTAFDAAWADALASRLSSDSDCARVLARRSHGDRVTARLRPKVRAHLDACATCRAASGEPAGLAERLMTSLPILVLGGAAGIAFLEATRAGSSATALEPVPPVDERGAVATLVASTGAGLSALARTPEPAGRPTAPIPPAPSAEPAPSVAASTVHRFRPRRRVVVAGLLGAVAAAAVVVAVSLTGPLSTERPTSLGAAGAGDIAEQAPGMMPPVVVATELPGATDDPGPDDGSAPPTDADAPEPGTESGADARDESASGETGATDSGSTPGGDSDPSPTDPPSDDTPEPPTGDPGTPIVRDPVSAPAGPSGPITYEVGKPGANGWRTLTLSGTPGASYVVSNDGDVLYTGVLDSDGSAELAIRGSISNLSIGYGLSALTAGSSAPGDQ
ncbi:hypothetical protein BCL57_000885 [Agromyces flavus]|uniref:DNA-directed RNA polymerase specialized sigma subunit, sigma24 family n=1 Tax=Agromyces flavus TaxID=589382 RepID=A0A1H1YMX0_9MICO|nr:sigma-70 region 4 domain-containing protein [Agromyces flavus]MCP2366743.1 hypothetical protein [Agromyces flavus]GGI45285.1 hypothetical protein GCM10010932_08870 [Agromyces flavus]SDT22773.1 hypothetical protein SAMN04489721_2818 [Agromyces flavus]